jgi:hypothetical protein
MATPIKGSPYTFTLSLFSTTTSELLTNPTITAGDVSLSTDGGAVASLTTTPSVIPASSGVVEVNLTSAEVGNEHFVVLFEDIDNEWKTVVYHETVALPSTGGGGVSPAVGALDVEIESTELEVEIITTEHEVNLV